MFICLLHWTEHSTVEGLCTLHTVIERAPEGMNGRPTSLLQSTHSLKPKDHGNYVSNFISF